MTQDALAELLGVCKRSVQAYEAGERIPHRHLLRLSAVFDRAAAWFLHGEDVDRPGGGEGGDEILRRLDLHAQLLGKLASEVAAIRRALEPLGARSAGDAGSPP